MRRRSKSRVEQNRAMPEESGAEQRKSLSEKSKAERRNREKRATRFRAMSE